MVKRKYSQCFATGPEQHSSLESPPLSTQTAILPFHAHEPPSHASNSHSHCPNLQVWPPLKRARHTPFSHRNLPPNILSCIFCFLSHREVLLSVAPVCKYYYEVSRNAFMWHQIQSYEAFAASRFNSSCLKSLTSLLAELFVNNALAEYRHFTRTYWNGTMAQTTSSTSAPSPICLKEIHQLTHALPSSSHDTSLLQVALSSGEKSKFCPVRQLYLPKECANLHEAHTLSELLQICPLLTQVYLPQRDNTQCKSLTDHGLYLLSTMCQHLHTLHLSTHDAITNQGIRYLSRNLSHQLKELNLNHCHRVTCDAVIDLLRNCPQLKTLSALFCRNCIFTEDKLRELAPHMRHLEFFALEVHTKREEENLGMLELGKYAVSLTTLHLRGWDSMDSHSFSNLLKGLKSLKKLTISCSGTPQVGHVNVRHEKLKHISISRCKLLHMVHFNCPQLETFFAESIQTIHGLSFDAPKLKTLKLRSASLEKMNWTRMMESCPSLIEFDLLDCLGVSNISLESTSLKTVSVVLCNELRQFSLKSSSVDSLTLDGCMQLQEAHIRTPQLSRCNIFQTVHQNFPQLHDLHLYTETLDCLSLLRCINLKTATLDSPSLTNLDLSGCKRLETLSMQCPGMIKMAVSASKISPDDIKQLAKNCPRVQLLNLLNAENLTDGLLETLVHESNWHATLSALSLSGCSHLVCPSLKLPFLKGLNVSNCSRLDRITISKSSSLQKCFFKACPVLSDECLHHIQQTASSSMSLMEIDECDFLRNLRLEAHSLQTVSIKRCENLSSVGLKCPRLNNLVVMHCPNFRSMDESGVPSQYLKHVVFQHNPRMQDSVIESLNLAAPRLQKLSISNCHLVSPSFKQTTLSQIIFNECNSLRSPSFASNVEGLVCRFRVCPMLQVNSFSSLFPQQKKTVEFFEVLRSGITNFELCHSVVNVNINLCAQLSSLKLKSKKMNRCLIKACPQLTGLLIHGSGNSRCRIQECTNLKKEDVKVKQCHFLLS